jgi:hypothetical protein
MQGAIFLYLPSILLSGLLFPFAAMPACARAIGEGPAAVWRELPPLMLCAALGFLSANSVWCRGGGYKNSSTLRTPRQIFAVIATWRRRREGA